MGIWNWIVKIAQTITKGRDAGLWSKKHGSGLNLDRPAKPEDIKGIKR